MEGDWGIGLPYRYFDMRLELLARIVIVKNSG